MNATEVRNILIEGLHRYLGGGISVYRSGQVSEEQPLPYVIYTVTGTNGSGNTMGHYTVQKKGYGAEEIKGEQASMTLSFTACSQNRMNGKSNYIQGEDEAQEIAEKAHGWFAHTGYDYFAKNNIVISEVTQIQGRNALMIDEEANRKGFDVICRYITEGKRDIAVVDKINIKREKEEKDERRSSIGKGG